MLMYIIYTCNANEYQLPIYIYIYNRNIYIIELGTYTAIRITNQINQKYILDSETIKLV